MYYDGRRLWNYKVKPEPIQQILGHRDFGTAIIYVQPDIEDAFIRARNRRSDKRSQGYQIDLLSNDYWVKNQYEIPYCCNVAIHKRVIGCSRLHKYCDSRSRLQTNYHSLESITITKLIVCPHCFELVNDCRVFDIYLSAPTGK